MKKRMNKKAISEMISYVILIAMAVGLSIGVFIWLKDFTNISPKIDCKDGTSLRLDDVTCASNIITVKVKNNGNFNVDGFVIQASEDINKIPTKKLLSIFGAFTPGYYDFASPLKPSDSSQEVSFAKEGPVELIQIQPYIKDEKGKIVICEQAVIKHDTSGCGLIPLDPLSITGIISWWSFNGDAEDENNINAGNCIGNACPTLTTGRDGAANGAYLFDGVDDYVNANFALPASFSVGVWFKTSSISGGIKRILFRGTTSNPSDGETFLIDINDIGGIRAGVKNTTAVWQLVSSSGPYNDGEFHYAILIYNDSTNNISLYIDGNLKNSLLFAGTVNNVNSTFRIGSANPAAENFTGTIDDVMIFDRALTSAEIRELYEKPYTIPTAPIVRCPNGECEPGLGENFLTCPSDCGLETIPSLVSWWRLNETDGGLALDYKDGNTGNIYGDTRLLMRFDEGSGNPQDNSSYDNDGVNNGAAWTSDGRSGNALNFDGIGDYVNVSDSPILRFTSASDVSIEFWAKLNNDPGWIMHNYDGVNNYWQIELRGDGKIWSQWRINPNYLRVESTTDLTSVVGWHHIVVVYKGSEKNASIYVDGIIQNSSRNTSLSGNFYNSNKIEIGRYVGPPLEDVTGTIDEVAIYSNALSPSEITEHFNAGRAKFIERIPGKSGSGNALSFDGIDDYVNVTDSLALRLGTNQTIGAWVNVSAYPSVFTRFVGKGVLDDRNYGLWISSDGDTLFQIRTSSVECNFYNNRGSGDPANIALSSGWRHIVGTYNGSVGKLYIDGNVVNSSICSITPPISIAPLTIGSSMYQNFSGSIDEVVIFNQTLNETAIRNIYCKQGGTAGCP